MVRRVLASLTVLTSAGLMVLCGCQYARNAERRPNFDPGQVLDSTPVIAALPDTGAIKISKNGYREFDLDAIVTDSGGVPDPTIRWSLSPGPMLNDSFRGDTAMIGPVANQTGKSYVTFTATDGAGLSVCRTCSVVVFDSFQVTSPLESCTVARNDTLSVPVTCKYKTMLMPKLRLDTIIADPALQVICSYKQAIQTCTLKLEAKSPGTAGVYFTVYDPVNHVRFPYSFLVTIP